MGTSTNLAAGNTRRDILRGRIAALRTARALSPLCSEVHVSRRAMACEFSVTFPGGCRRALEAGCAALDEIDRLEEKLSAYLGGSEICRLNRAAHAGPVAADPEVFSLLDKAARISHATAGAFDAASGALSRAWGFFQGPFRVPANQERERALASSGMGLVELDRVRRTVQFRRAGVEFNLGAIGKGYAIDRALARLAEDFGIRSVLIEGGQSSVKAGNPPPGEPRGWKVALGDPHDPGRTLAAIYLRNRALGTSGAAFQHFVVEGRCYGHVLNPRTGWPADRVASASALAPSAAEADALSTAFFVLGVDGTRRYCREHHEIAAVLVTKCANECGSRIILFGLSEPEVEFVGAARPLRGHP